MCRYILLLTCCLFLQLGWSQTTAQLANTRYQQVKRQLPNIDHDVLKLALLAYENAKLFGFDHKGLLTIVDFSLPSNQKRLWLINLNSNQLLYHTYVTHGAGSGFLFAKRFSNKDGSHQSSIGVFNTKTTYTGSVGYSLRLDGLERGFNDHALRRAIVMHGATYANPDFIEQYGRLGRSWGCFALPENNYRQIIDLTKKGSIIFAYYPNPHWLSHSIYLKSHQAIEM